MSKRLETILGIGSADLVATRAQLANQLRSLLESFWPGATAVFADMESPIGLAFTLHYSTPEWAGRLDLKRMTAFCAKHAYRGRRSADKLLARLHQAPAVTAGDSRHANAWAASVSAKPQARGCDHPHATRILARAWPRVIWRGWMDRKPYDPASHGSAELLLKTRG